MSHIGFERKIKQVLGGNTDALSATTTEYGCISGYRTLGGVEFNREIIFAVAGTLKNFYVELANAPGAGESYTFTIRKNGADTSIVVTISGTDISGSDTTNTVSVNVGDKVCFKVVPSAAPATGICHHGIEFDPR